MIGKLKLLGSFLLVAIIATVGYYGYSIYKFTHEIQADPNDDRFPNQSAVENHQPPEWEGTERVNILLLGGDSRGHEKNEIPRSDAIMVASLDPVKKTAYLFSILRDTYVHIPGHGHDRINAAITYGGPKLAMKTVSELLNIPIQYYVYTDFQGFIALVDAIGGIEYEVEKDMAYSGHEMDREYDINLKKGLQHLDGKESLQYVRFRHDALSDYARTERQRKFLKAVAEKLQSTSSIVKLPKILNSVQPYIETNLKLIEMIKLGNLAYKVNLDTLVSQQLPPTELLQEKNINGASVIWAEPRQLQQFVQEIFEKTPDASEENNTETSEPSNP